MARVYGWPVGLTQEDLICVPGMLVFGFTPATDPIMELGQLFCEVGFHQDLGPALKEVEGLPRFEPQEVGAIYLCPLERLSLDPEVVVVYGNPAQLMRLIQAATFSLGVRVSGEFGGKVECSEYLIAPYRTEEFRVVIPGMGDRIFSMTQDDELVVAFPGKFLEGLLVGLKDAAKKIGARYPITVYQNFSPSFHRPMKSGPRNGGSLRVTAPKVLDRQSRSRLRPGKPRPYRIGVMGLCPTSVLTILALKLPLP